MMTNEKSNRGPTSRGPLFLGPLLAAALAMASQLASTAPSDAADLTHLKTISKPDSVDLAVERGTKWLVRQQDKTGKFKGIMPNTETALSCIALMSNGHFPGRSPYGENLRKGIVYLTQTAIKQKGYFGTDDGNSRMYGQAICTLALVEAYGMMQKEEENKQIRLALKPALAIIIGAQCKAKGQFHGGWHYNTKNATADLSVSAWQILALRAAQNCKLDVPAQVMTDATAYVRRMYNPRDKAFSYNGSKATASMRSAGVVCMLALGANETDADKIMIRNSAGYLLSFNPAAGNYYYYQSYYVGSAANMMGGKYREQVLPRLEKSLLKLQQKDGQFKKHQGAAGGTYATAFSLISLSIRNQFLPVYQEK